MGSSLLELKHSSPIFKFIFPNLEAILDKFVSLNVMSHGQNGVDLENLLN